MDDLMLFMLRFGVFYLIISVVMFALIGLAIAIGFQFNLLLLGGIFLIAILIAILVSKWIGW